jgi:hypothetical protein
MRADRGYAARLYRKVSQSLTTIAKATFKLDVVLIADLLGNPHAVEAGESTSRIHEHKARLLSHLLHLSHIRQALQSFFKPR